MPDRRRVLNIQMQTAATAAVTALQQYFTSCIVPVTTCSMIVDHLKKYCVLQNLDELQCHLLLKRWLKDNDISIPPPAAAPAAAAPAAAAPLALPAPAAGTGVAPAAAASTAAKPSSSPGQAVLPLDVVQGVADYYAEERIYLAKCQQFIVMTASE